jgi:hypothetical protein
MDIVIVKIRLWVRVAFEENPSLVEQASFKVRSVTLWIVLIPTSNERVEPFLGGKQIGSQSIVKGIDH